MNSCVTCTDMGEYRIPSLVMEYREERVGHRGWSSATYAFCRVQYWTQQTVGGWLRKRKQRSQCTVEAKRARREEQEKVQKKKTRKSSQAKYKLCSLFMFGSTVVVLELLLISDICSTWPTRMRIAHIRTGAARREASCACIVLVILVCAFESFLSSITRP